MKLDGRRDFHEARWDEPILMEMGALGQRAILTEAIEPEVAQAAGCTLSTAKSRLYKALALLRVELDDGEV